MSEKPAFQDNVWLRTPKDTRGEFFQVTVNNFEASFTRYTVPGRCDTYTFTWRSSTEVGVGSSVSMFSDHTLPLRVALTRVNADLKKPQVKRLIKRAVTEVRWGKPLIKALLQQVKK